MARRAGGALLKQEPPVGAALGANQRCGSVVVGVSPGNRSLTRAEDLRAHVRAGVDPPGTCPPPPVPVHPGLRSACPVRAPLGSPAAPPTPRNARAVDRVGGCPAVRAPPQTGIAVAVVAPSGVGVTDHDRRPVVWIPDPIVDVLLEASTAVRGRVDEGAGACGF